MIADNPSKQKGKHGIASLESVRGRLRIHLPRAWYGKKNKYLTLGLVDTPKHREIAKRKLEWIQGELDQGTFDPTLERYQPTNKQETYLKLVNESNPQITLVELWDSYLAYLAPIRKASTMEYFAVNISDKVAKCPIVSPYNAIEIRDWLLEITTIGQVKRVLTQLNAAFKWGAKHKKLTASISPFEGMAKEIEIISDSKPIAFTLEERDRVLDAFRQSRYYKHYTPFVEFMFLTGCRPNEAIGLEWNDIDPDYRFITFNGGITCASGKRISSKGKGSKNNRVRKFLCNEYLRNFLATLPRSGKLVFPSPDGIAIHYNNFSRRAWDVIANPIKPDTTPYSCRDTFITEQVAKGVSAAIIGKWVDNSVRMIEKHYLDMASIDHILPQ